MTFPQPDCYQVLKHLEFLSYQPTDKLNLTCLFHSQDSRKRLDKGCKLNRLSWAAIETYQSYGRGVYLVVNGGGYKNKDISQGRAVFYEHDYLDKLKQVNLWQELELPAPTFQVDTGGRSIHSYWVFDEPIGVEQWCHLQRDLLEYADADRSLKNPARLMRLAGTWHILPKAWGNSDWLCNLSQIITETGRVYGYERLRNAVPQFQSCTNSSPLVVLPKTSPIPKPIDFPNPLTIQHFNQIPLPIPLAIPLYYCCRIKVRSLLDSGVPKGSGRNNAAIAIGLELLTVERYVQLMGQPFSDSARQLFSGFCTRSFMTPEEDAERWNWCYAQKTSITQSLQKHIRYCIRTWYWQVVKNKNNIIVSDYNPVNET